MGANPLISLLLLISVLPCFLLTTANHHRHGSPYPSPYLHDGHNEWVVEVAEGTTDEDVRSVLDGGVTLVGKLRGLENRYVVRSTLPVYAQSPIGSRWDASRSVGGRWRRSAGFEIQNPGFQNFKTPSHPILAVHPQRHLLRTKRSIIPHPPLDPTTPLPTFNDPLWAEQWQLHERFSQSQLSSQPIRADHRITDVWSRLNLTGRGVVVTIVDDGMDHRHGDLAANYDPLASYDFNDDDADPMPGPGEVNSHGTRCAGLVAMVGNNSLCGVGVAHNAGIGAIRLLDGHLTDRLEAEAFSHQSQHIDIVSVSWGPADDGRTVEGPGPLSALAVERGVRQGRRGLGTVYVWASGNGGGLGDDCAADGYASSPYSFTVAGVARDGSVPWYAESCANTLVSTYSTGNLLGAGGVGSGDSIVTTEPGEGDRCTLNHTGTSAATPIAVGIIALVLEAK